jgi:hypothetical protein
MAASVRVPWVTVERYLADAFEPGEPMTRDDLIQHAIIRGAPALVIEVLEKLSDVQQFKSLDQVNRPLRNQGYTTDYRR